MECRSCGVTSNTTLCQICQYEADLAASRKPGPSCSSCGMPIELRPGRPPLCEVCGDLLLTVGRREWFIRAQAEWDQENLLLAQRKKELLGQRGPFAA